MGKAPAFQFYVGDYIKDTRMLSPAARGIWADCLMFMWHSDERGTVSGTIAQLSRMFSATEAEVHAAVDELKCTKVADVTECNGIVTLTNRRMVREERERKSTRCRVKRFRNGDNKRDCNDDVTGPSSSSSSSSNQKPKDFTSPKPATVAPKKPLSESPNLTHRLVGKFSEAYEKATGQVYAMAPGRDGKLMREIAAALANGGGMEEPEIEAHVVAAIARFFDEGHKFKGNFDIPQFKRAFNRLQVAHRDPAAARF